MRVMDPVARGALGFLAYALRLYWEKVFEALLRGRAMAAEKCAKDSSRSDSESSPLATGTARHGTQAGCKRELVERARPIGSVRVCGV